MRRGTGAVALAVVFAALPVVDVDRAITPRVTSVALRAGTLIAQGPFAMVGVTWPANAQNPARVSVRTRTVGGPWTPWTEMSIDDEVGPDEGGRRGTAPLWVGEASMADVTVDGAIPAGSNVVFIDPGVNRGGAVAFASPGAPGVVSRRQWGADERIRRGEPRYTEGVGLAFVHHTATGNGYAATDSARIVRGIYAYHVQGRGWNDIGYNALVDRFGRVFEGRAGGLDRPVIGAHTRGFNSGSFGVASIGTHTSSGITSAAKVAITKTLSWKLDLHHVDPSGTVTVTSGGGDRYPAGAKVKLKTISGHRDVGHTSCPGGALYTALPGIRKAVTADGSPKIFAPTVSSQGFTPNADGVVDTVVARARLSSSADWKVEIADAAGRVVRVLEGSGPQIAARWDGTDTNGLPVPHGRYRLRLKAWTASSHARPAEATVSLWAWPDGTLLSTPDTTYLLEAGALRKFSGKRALESSYRRAEAVKVVSAVGSVYPRSSTKGWREGSLVRVGGTVWLISSGYRRPISADTFRELGFDARAVVDASASELGPHPAGPRVEADLWHPDGVALRGAALPAAWRLDGLVRTIVSETAYATHGLGAHDAVGTADAEIAASPHGPPLGFRDGTLIRNGPRVWVIADGFRRLITSEQRFAVFGYRASNVVDVTEAEAAVHPEGAPL